MRLVTLRVATPDVKVKMSSVPIGSPATRSAWPNSTSNSSYPLGDDILDASRGVVEIVAVFYDGSEGV
jgi:hypothetical protein